MRRLASIPGFSFDPIWTMSTERSNATYFDGVRIGREYVLGEEQQGWRTLSIMLGFERGMGNTGFGVPVLRRGVEWAEAAGAIEEPLVRDALALFGLPTLRDTPATAAAAH